MAGTGRVGRPQGADSAETLERIVVAARQHFAAAGYRATTNRQIADAVGITAGALYHYVPSKAALYALAFRVTVDSVYGEFETVAKAETGLTRRFMAVLRRASELQAADSTVAAFIVAASQETQRNPELIGLLGAQRNRHARFFASLVDDAVASGELAVDDAVAIADVFAATLSGLARLAVGTGDMGRYDGAVVALQQLWQAEYA